MPSFSNGRFPLSMFEHIEGNIYLPAATAARWRGFRDDVRAETGVTLRITGNIDGLGGWNGYRPFDAQVRYKAHYGPKAAEPGKSSHGGVYRGSDFFAFDVANSDDIPWSTFVRLAKKWGLMTDFVTPTERWHVGDPNPWSMPASSGGTTSKEDDMTPEQASKLDYIYSALAKTYGDQLTAIINVMRSELAPAIASIAAGNILFPGATYNAFRALANAIQAEDGTAHADIDEEKLAAELAPALAPLIAANLGTLTDATINDLVERLLDEQAKRMAG